MTTLRDDGDMETDDAVVQACFLGKPVRRLRGGKWINDILGRIEINHSVILIPASVVAEAVEADIDVGGVFVNLVLGSIGMYDHPTYTLTDWLREHA